MDTSASSNKSLLRFFSLIFALSIPFWLVGTFAEHLSIGLPLNLPVSALMFPCPLIAALILVYREDGPGGIRRLLNKVFDYKRIRPKIWYVPIIFLLPIIYLLSYGIMRLMGLPLLELHISFLTIPILFVVFFISAAGEEAGWMGYAVDPMQDRWSALKTGIILGLLWSIWHVVPDIQAHQTWAYIAGQRFYSVVLRILIVWLYNNTGKSVFAAILFHDMDNVTVYSLFPNTSTYYYPAITGVLTAIAAVTVTFLWGSKTLARYRYACPPENRLIKK
ncbi:MAG: CPBP family intramembrane metalloprotease [Alphaproteobacteria bacterium]|nr:MAG: CPBP family intramembrane metalloprotease [Alphaproteobacteria bacterium]